MPSTTAAATTDHHHQVAAATTPARRARRAPRRPSVRLRGAARTGGLVALDALAISGAGLLSGVSPDITLLVSAVGVLVLGGWGAYRSRLHLSALDDVPMLAAVAGATWVADVAADVVLHRPPVAAGLWHALVAGLLLVAVRATTYACSRHVRRRGRTLRRTLVVGGDGVGVLLASTAAQRPEYGLRPVGVLADTGSTTGPTADQPVPVVGAPDDVAACVRRWRAEVLLVCDDAPDGVAGGATDSAADVVEAGLRAGCRVWVRVPPGSERSRPGARTADQLWGTRLVRVRRSGLPSGGRAVKRLVDVTVGGTALVLALPVMALVALAVRWEVGRSVLLRQDRVGQDGRVFTLLKFRSLPLGGGADVAPVWSISRDPRLGPVGRLIRTLSLDELPQLVNVVRGEMSLVGPRPERPFFVEQYRRTLPSYDARHRVPSGLTGWAQVNGLRGDTSIEDRVRFDNYYIENWGLWFDVTILVRTVAAVVLGRGS